MIRNNIFYGLFLTTILLGCLNKSEARNEKKSDKQIQLFHKGEVQNENLELISCHELNLKAVKLIEKSKIHYKLKKDRDSVLKEAICMLDYCIKKDSTYIDAYLNKSFALRRLGRYEQSINVLLDITKRDKNPKALFGVGIIYNKQGNSLKAKEYFKEAVVAYDYLIAKEGSRFDLLDYKEFVLLFLEGKEKRLKNIESLIKKNPNDEDLIDRKMMIDYFDAKKFIDSF